MSAKGDIVRRIGKPTQQNRGRDHVARRLQELIESSGYSISRLERDMDLGRGYVAEALRGGKKLTVELIMEILAALDLKLEEIFALNHPRDVDSAQEHSPQGMTAGMRDASPLLQAVVLTLASKGLVSLDEVEERQRQISTTLDEERPKRRRAP